MASTSAAAASPPRTSAAAASPPRTSAPAASPPRIRDREGTMTSPILITDSAPSTSSKGHEVHDLSTFPSLVNLARPPLHGSDNTKADGDKTLNSEAAEAQVKNEGGLKEATTVRKEGASAMDDDDDDFKVSRKRLRVAPDPDIRPVSKRKKLKGVVYEDVQGEKDHPELVPDSYGRAKWRMEVTGAVGLGIPQSHIMDTGPIGQTSEPVKASIPEQFTPVPPIQCLDCNCGSAASIKQCKSPEDDRALRLKYPKIYFATRTHKQVAQITHELNKTAYRDTPMSILASREHTCIHPMVSKSKDKNEECKKLLDYDNGVSCPFFHKVQAKLGSQAQLRQLGLDTAWDIEDLIRVGNRVRACPYYATRGLIDEADIIFCPYNYLIDPLIRDQMLIDLNNKVVILDEAHNIEDTAREAASLSITSYQLHEVSAELEDIIPLSPTTVTSYKHLQALVMAIMRWIERTAETLPAKGYEQAFGVWSGTDFLPILDKEFGVNESTLQTYKKHLEAATEAAMDKNSDRFDEDNKRHAPEPTLTLVTIGRIKSILVVMGYLFHNGKKYLSDYRMSLMKSAMMLPKTNNWIRRGRKKSYEKSFVYTLNFWCFNPSVAFSDLTMCRSIILTSGTLSPMASFASELGASFPVQLEANHVIHESQTLIRSLSHGPNGVQLSATFQNSETYEFKDELGALVLGVCETVPFGILCFMSSYKMLEKLTTRWQETGVWDRILAHKEIVCEPRTGGREVFDEVMSTFYEAIAAAAPTAHGVNRRTGALFFAVCRGKVSEGLDFTDNNARAVITVGIPFPSIKNKQIELKREYNNEHTQRRGLLPGKDWYEIQAYRALNQALGRCIRHKQDWGALLLVDARYSKGPHYTKGLSKWIRQRIQHEYDFKKCMASLKDFVDRMMSGEMGDAGGNDSKSSTISSSPKSDSTAPPGLQVAISSSSSSPLPVPHPVSPSVTSSYFMLNSPAASIPDNFQSSPPVPTSINTCVPSSSSTPVKAPLRHRDLPPSFPCPSSSSQCSSSVSLRSSVHQTQSMPGFCQHFSSSTRQYPHIIPIQDIISTEKIGSDVANNERPPVMAVAVPEASSDVHSSGVAVESAVMLGGTDTTVLYGEDLQSSANGDAKGLKDDTPSMNDKDKNMVAETWGVYSEDLSVSSCQEETEDSVLATSIPDTPPSPPMMDSPLMFELPNPKANHDALSSVIERSDELVRDTSEVDGQNDVMKDVLENACNALQPIDVDIDVQNSFVKEILEENESRNQSGIANEVADSGGSVQQDIPSSVQQDKIPSSVQQDKILISELSKVNDMEDVEEEEEDVKPVTSVGGSSVKDKRSLLVKRKKLNTRRAASRVTRRSAARAGKIDDAPPKADVRCPCGEVLASPDSAEAVDLKKVLTQQCGVKVAQVTSSTLWRHLHSGKGKFEALLFPVSNLKLSLKKGTDAHYNSVWDEKLGVCYSFIECPLKCDQCVGVCIHAATNLPNSHELTDKVILPAHYKS